MKSRQEAKGRTNGLENAADKRAETVVALPFLSFIYLALGHRDYLNMIKSY